MRRAGCEIEAPNNSVDMSERSAKRARDEDVEAEIGGEGDINAQFQAVQDSLNKVTCVNLGMHR